MPAQDHLSLFVVSGPRKRLRSMVQWEGCWEGTLVSSLGTEGEGWGGQPSRWKSLECSLLETDPTQVRAVTAGPPRLSRAPCQRMQLVQAVPEASRALEPPPGSTPTAVKDTQTSWRWLCTRVTRTAEGAARAPHFLPSLPTTPASQPLLCLWGPQVRDGQGTEGPGHAGAGGAEQRRRQGWLAPRPTQAREGHRETCWSIRDE